MPPSDQTRRSFLSTSIAAAGLAAAGPGSSAAAADAKASGKSDAKPRIGAIGMRYQGSVIAHKAHLYGDIVAICDVDRNIREQSRASFGSTPRIYEDYRDLLKQGNVDVVTIGAPDHWHVAMAIDACRAGKDVYVEKPLSLTIDEGKQLRQVAQETGRIIQVGSWQRSDCRFRLAVEMVRQGRIGKLKRVDVVLGKNKVGGPFKVADPPPTLNWDLWLGPAPSVPFMHERCHYTFRWWYEYAGGQPTDWGAHHLDIAQWAIGENPIEVRTKAKFPQTAGGFNVPIDFAIEYRYPGGVVMAVADHGRTGIIFTGTEGRIFVNRGTIAGKPVDDLAANPLPRDRFSLYSYDNLDRPERAGKLDAIVNHMGNFFDCVKSRQQPLSDIESQHRSATTCHLANLSIRLGRTLAWDPEAEQFVDDPEANEWLTRQRRAGFELG
jgi:myo-inositol 2-dehydrogenase / D-chiro-inositol 1-dehydrogenase